MFDDPRREQDLLIAKLVMGWTNVTYDGISCYGLPLIEELSKYKHHECGYGLYHIPRYLSDANADYLVLCKVRETWCHRMPAIGGKFPFYSSFYYDLKQIWYNRKRPGNITLSCYVSWEPSMYEIGDYSRAALMSFKPENKEIN